MTTIDVEAPDGWVCEVAEIRLGVYSPMRWKLSSNAGGRDEPAPLSDGLRAYRFATAHAAMMAAYRERRFRHKP
jgi:hypothetical protein